MKNLISAQTLVDVTRDLLTDGPANPEYDRALNEVVRITLGFDADEGYRVDQLLREPEGTPVGTEPMAVELTFADGSFARWAAVDAEQADRIEQLIGKPDTVGP